MKKYKVFISYSGYKQFAQKVAERLRQSDLAPWLDQDQVVIGDKFMGEMDAALKTMDILVALLSREALESVHAADERDFAHLREAREKHSIVAPFIIDDTPLEEFPYYLQLQHVSTIPRDKTGADRVAEELRIFIERRIQTPEQTEHKTPETKSTDVLERTLERYGQRLITFPYEAHDVTWDIIMQTDVQGNNPLVEILVCLLESENDDVAWGADAVLEQIARLNPNLISDEHIRRMASSSIFHVRSLAGGICMELAEAIPGRVPLDVLARLARYNEDWYVRQPAKAAIQILIHSRPVAQDIFMRWLKSDNVEERAYAAYALSEVAAEEPELIDVKRLRQIVMDKDRPTNNEYSHYMRACLEATQHITENKFRYRYGI